jgi:hypothetical protein
VRCNGLFYHNNTAAADVPEASSEVSGEFEYRWNMRAVPRVMLDRPMQCFAR